MRNGDDDDDDDVSDDDDDDNDVSDDDNDDIEFSISLIKVSYKAEKSSTLPRSLGLVGAANKVRNAKSFWSLVYEGLSFLSTDAFTIHPRETAVMPVALSPLS